MRATHITKSTPVKILRQSCGQRSDEVTAVPIPLFNTSGVLPPFVGDNPTNPAQMPPLP